MAPLKGLQTYEKVSEYLVRVSIVVRLFYRFKRLGMIFFAHLLKIFMGLSGLFSAMVEAVKSEGRWRYARRQYQHVFFDRGVVVDAQCKFGKNVRIFKNTILSQASIGDCSYVGGDSILKNCMIGKFCAVAPEVRIGLGIHPVTDVISTYPGFYSSKASGATSFHLDPSVVESKCIKVGNDVWIGMRSMVLDGVAIGDGAVVAAGSVVTRDVAPYSVVGGIPARVIKLRFSESERASLLSFRWWDKDHDFLRKHGSLFLDARAFISFFINSNVECDEEE